MKEKIVEFASKAIILVFVLLVGIYHIEIKDYITGKTRNTPVEPQEDKSKIDDINSEITSTTIFSSDNIPGYTIVQNIGVDCEGFIYEGMKSSFWTNFIDAGSRLKKSAEEKGANAIINARVSSSTAELQGSKWNSSIVLICGDYVKIRKNEK